MAKKKKTLSKKQHYENNKFLLILLIVLAFILVIVYASVDFKKQKSYSAEELRTSLNSSTVTIPDTSFAVTLEEGKAEFADNTLEGNVEISEPFYSVKNKTSYDAFAVMTYKTGESDEFVTIALFQVVKGKAIFRGSYPVGDRVEVNALSKSSGEYEDGYKIKVDYTDKNVDEAMVDDPTNSKSLTFEIKDHMIVAPPPTGDE